MVLRPEGLLPQYLVETVAAVLYKLNGKSQASLVATPDGTLYVLKPHGFPGSHGLMNEVIGTEIARHVGLPVPRWVLLAVDDALLDANPGLWYRSGSTVIRPRAGVHFGSQLVLGSDRERSFQIIPHAWIDRVTNRADFAAMLILDLWINQCDRRQAIYVGDRKKLRAIFVDNDHILGGRFGNDETCARRAMTPDLDTYRGLWRPEVVEAWVDRIKAIEESWITRMIASIPQSWMEDIDPNAVVETLVRRQRRLKALVGEVSAVLAHGYSVKSTRSVGATRPMLISRLA